MAFTYDLTAPGNREDLRLQIGDTTSGTGNYVFEDAELDRFLSRASNDINLASAMACRSLATSYARRAIWYRVNGIQGFEMDRRDPAKRFLEMAKNFEETAKSAVFEYESIIEDYVDSAGEDRSNYIDVESADT